MEKPHAGEEMVLGRQEKEKPTLLSFSASCCRNTGTESCQEAKMVEERLGDGEEVDPLSKIGRWSATG